ncbi:hypothetical protein Golax_024958 [Gossypium laxum]|uniref:MADS-box domain-containing protein n=1 Tax=Gossypium laxum TaxID=34288 RepID=A0A7J8ZDN5_9ROSI|nr:hypothetical protein [Gossypium laxum]
MTRKKINLVYITNDSTRKAAYKKRKKVLMRKVSYLSTLWEIDACAIMYNSYETQPEVWPSPMGVQQVLSKFNNIPKMEQSKMENQESFLSRRITKVAKQLKKNCKEIWEKEMIQCSTTFVANGSSVTHLNPQSASSSLSSSMVTLAPMMMVMPKAMSRTSTEEIRQTEVDNMEMMNNNNL